MDADYWSHMYLTKLGSWSMKWSMLFKMSFILFVTILHHTVLLPFPYLPMHLRNMGNWILINFYNLRGCWGRHRRICICRSEANLIDRHTNRVLGHFHMDIHALDLEQKIFDRETQLIYPRTWTWPRDKTHISMDFTWEGFSCFLIGEPDLVTTTN